MTRMVTAATVVVLLTLFVGCETDTGQSVKRPIRTNSEPPGAMLTAPASTTEIDLVEKMTAQREDYRRSLQALIQHYDAAGNNLKVTWAREELTALDRMPQYRYLVELPVNLKPSQQIAAADELYAEAERTKRQAGAPLLPPQLKNQDLLRAALGKYYDLISRYPTSDKIDDAAYKMGDIQEDLNDPTLALLAYQRAYQWDPATPYPARFKAAAILDKKLHRRAEALQVYQEAIIKEAQYTDYRLMAERRVEELNTSTDAPK